VDKGTLTVVGNVDPVCIVLALRKKKCCAEIESVDEDKKEEPEKEESKKEDDECKKIEECDKLLAETYCVPPCTRWHRMCHIGMSCYMKIHPDA